MSRKLQNIRPQPQGAGGYSAPAVIRRNQEEAPPRLTVNQKEAARMCGLSERPFKRLADKYRIPCIQLGRGRRYSKAVIQNLIDNGLEPAAEMGSEDN